MADNRRKMWFGTRDFMQWVPMPQVDRPASRSGWSSSSTFLGGGASVRRSAVGAINYEMDFGLQSREDARSITDFYDGVYGEGPFYWIDPMTKDQNVLPQTWATPALTAKGGASVTYDRTRPTLVDTPANTKGFPVKSAYFSSMSNAPSIEETNHIWVPIPPGQTLLLYGWGSSSGTATVWARYSNGVDDWDGAQLMPWNTVTAPSPVALRLDSSSTYGGVMLYFAGSGSLTVTALQAVLVPTAKVNTVRNEVTNPSFELGTAGWSSTASTLATYANSTSSWSALPYRSGSNMLVSTANGTSPYNRVLTDPSPVSPGQRIGVKAVVVSETNLEVRAMIRFLDSNGALLESSPTTFVPANFYSGALLQVIGLAPPGVASYQLDFQQYSGDPATNIASGKRMWIEGVFAVREWSDELAAASLAQGYADGDTPGWTWSGTPHASSSYKTGYVWNRFTSGQGHSGCEFVNLEKTDYSAAMDKVGVTADMLEVGQWL